MQKGKLFMIGDKKKIYIKKIIRNGLMEESYRAQTKEETNVTTKLLQKGGEKVASEYGYTGEKSVTLVTDKKVAWPNLTKTTKERAEHRCRKSKRRKRLEKKTNGERGTGKGGENMNP